LDYEFFKGSWVPITRNGLDYYIDLGSVEFQIFMADFFWLEPYGWYKKMIIPNFAWFLLISNESDFDSKEYVKAIRGWGKKPLTDFFNVHEISSDLSERFHLTLALEKKINR
jgi:hypothetical protein